MSNFWASRLPQPAPQPAPTVVPGQVGRAWWQPGVAPQTQPAPQVPQQPYVPSPAGLLPDGQVDIGTLLHQPGEYHTEKAQSAKIKDRCPSCDSANYMGIKRAAKRCFDCGYNDLFEQTMAGVSGIGQAGLPTYIARVQAPGTPANFGEVIAHIGPNGQVQ